jgi:hypothetical protein
MPITKKPKTGGGSRKGRPNRAKFAFREELQKYCDDLGFDPFHALVHMARDEHLDNDQLKFMALKELCQFLQPKLRSIEVTGDEARPLAIDIKTSLNRAFELAYEPGAAAERRAHFLAAANGAPRSHG